MSTVADAIAHLQKASIAEPDVMQPPSPEQIRDAEAKLGVALPPSFKTFLKQAGQYALPYWEVYWVGDTSLGYRQIVKANHSEHEEVASPLPTFLITFHNNGMGDQVCFDTRNPDARGEYPIVFWDHERSPEQNLKSLEVLAPDFASWLKQEAEFVLNEASNP